MKKIYYLLIAAIASLTVASCQKEQAEQFTPAGQGAGQEFTVSLPEVTKTALVEGKTVWAKNDSLWVSNGTLTEKIGVPEESWGQKSFTFKTKGTMITPETPNMYMVYPYEAASGVKEGKLSVKIPGFQKGEFNEANIVAAQTTTYSVSLKNVTAILKVTVPPQAETKNTPIYSLAIGATNGNALSGTCTVDFSGSDPVLTPTAKSTSISAQIDGLDDKDFYFAVIPGTYDAGFTLTAATTSFEYASETKTTKSAKTVKVNELVNLGSIGTDLKPLPGAGTETDPWQIESLGHMIALASAVSEGNTFAGKFLKVMNDIPGITMPVGYFPNAENNHPFCGDFNGNSKTLTIDINGAAQSSTIRLGLFGAIANGAHIHDMTIEGSVTSTGDALGSIAGRIDAAADKDPVLIENIINNATVSGPNYCGGIAGYIQVEASNLVEIKQCTNNAKISASGLYAGGIVGSSFDSKAYKKKITSCTNNGIISANSNSGGIIGSAYHTILTDCHNTGKVTAASPTQGIYTYSSGWKYVGYKDRGVGGIGGFMQNSSMTSCTNTADIKGCMHVGGIGGDITWTDVIECSNSGTITGTGKWDNGNLKSMTMVGGIIGWAYSHCNVKNCNNTGNITGNSLVGGIIGYIQGCAQTYGNANDRCQVNGNTNSGEITGEGKGVGGVCGGINAQQFWPTIYLGNCKNTGKVINKGEGAGGIAGMAYDLNLSKSICIWDCVNEGSVQGAFWCGGILGLGYGRVGNIWSLSIWNCENKGDILGNRPDDSGEVCGGIVGAVTNNSLGAAEVYVTNCLNTGSVQYQETSHVNPYCGGIVGHYLGGTMTNVCNFGYVGPVGGVEQKMPAADKLLGGLIGALKNNATLKECYYWDSCCSQVVGTANKQISDNPDNEYVLSYDKDGILSEKVTLGSTEVDSVEDALNLWLVVNEKTSYWKWEWADKPAFVK